MMLGEFTSSQRCPRTSDTSPQTQYLLVGSVVSGTQQEHGPARAYTKTMDFSWSCPCVLAAAAAL
jgi:hypothetical protein